jgi:hypothetical protein
LGRKSHNPPFDPAIYPLGVDFAPLSGHHVGYARPEIVKSLLTNRRPVGLYSVKSRFPDDFRPWPPAKNHPAGAFFLVQPGRSGI